ncbi:GTP cyclohydrolase-2 [Rickettsiales bacterium Ac37b]|nr:GTP cyclohydrolase-2 [Rickettsiales bacterium Ac37b]
MLNDINFSLSELSVLNVERAIADIKNSLAIVVKHEHNFTSLVISAEYFNTNHIKLLKKLEFNNLQLLISSNRANYLSNSKKFVYPVSIILNINDIDSINLITTSETSLNFQEYNFTQTSNEYNASLHLMKIAELLPAAIIVNIDCNNQYLSKWLNTNRISIIDHTEIMHCLENNASLLQEICRAPLKLKYTPNAEIVAFRATTGGKEHYALIIGDLSTSPTPLVRIHSSCYTGDLLTSLMCDCGDQLTTAIQYMASDKENAGIILYLMQEGRGIGFINKLRTYVLQSKGLDTVEANEAWGFDDDERPFIYACQILNLLNVKKVRLLSNNPQKAVSLKEGGIEILEVLPHKAKKNPYNNLYLKTKAEKLGHKL